MNQHLSRTDYSAKPKRLDGKHVIILGAGASFTSGYPLGEGLRQLLCSPDRLRKTIQAQLKEKFGDFERDLDYSLEVLERQAPLFRDGCFATVDQFLRMAGPRIGGGAEYLRRLLSLCFALHNPEEDPQQSDYYPFIQRLFDGDLARLRADIVVLTINYDPYLEFLLRRAYERRCEAKGKKASTVVLDAILSGFGWRLTKQLAQPGAFCLLKLHGTCALPFQHKGDDECPTHAELFSADPVERFRTVVQIGFADVGFSPIFFPWEIISGKGSFIPKMRFRHAKHRQAASDVELYPLFKAIWTRAQIEVREASKISFVGVSMHDYLKPGFRFLFKDKCEDVDLVVADPKPQKPAEQLEHWLKEFCPNLAWNTPIQTRRDFADFIQEEMEPRT